MNTECRYFTAASPIDIELLEVRANGAGRIRIPILPASSVMLERTAGGGEGRHEIDVAMLEAIVANMKRKPGPIPIFTHPHLDQDLQGYEAPAFLDAVELRGKVLFGEFSLSPGLFAAVVLNESFRGFSAELVDDPAFATGDKKGTFITGGVFTNAPSLDVHFRTTAGVVAEVMQQMQIAPAVFAARPMRRAIVALSLNPVPRDQRTKGGRKMDNLEVKLAAAELEKKAAAERIETLETQLTEKSAAAAEQDRKILALSQERDNARSEGQVTSSKLRQMTAQRDEEKARADRLLAERDEAREKVRQLEDAGLGERVRALVDKAIAAGHNRDAFANFLVEDADPAEEFRKTFGDNADVSALESFIIKLGGNSPRRVAATTSGNRPGDARSQDNQISDERKERMRAAGVDPRFARIRDAREARQLSAKLRENQQN